VYKLILLPQFQREAKKLIKKYPSLKDEIGTLGKQLISKPTTGIPLGDSCYKIRIAIASKGKGKSGGARIISYFYRSEDSIYLISIYDKKESISRNEIKQLLKQIR
jgi:mRNA-degrading endonuclease RelE of RelBE toxin-antitoxin system